MTKLQTHLLKTVAEHAPDNFFTLQLAGQRSAKIAASRKNKHIVL